MTINNTLNNLLARRTPLLINFSAAVTTSSTGLKCAGGESGVGIPIPSAGKVVSIHVWDGSTLKTISGEIDIDAGDRVDLFAEYDTTDFTVKLRINGVDAPLIVVGVAANSTITASLYIILE